MDAARTTLDGVEQQLRIEDTEKLRKKQRQLMDALSWLANASERDAMPRTWHGVLKLLHRATD